MTGMLRVTRIEGALADICSAREAPEEEFEGYLSIIITELNMSTLRQQNMLMCNEWFVFGGLFARLLLD
jgi:hypothetical protein